MLARADLERIFALFETGARPVFVTWDVHRAIDDDKVGSFDPKEGGRGQGYLAWSKTADASFDGDVLTQPLALQFAGSATRLQMVFAEAGLTVRVDVDEELDAVYGHTGTVVIPPDAAALETDLLRALAAFRELEADEVIALPCTGYTQSDGWSDVAERVSEGGGDESRRRRTACFWTDQGHDAFDGVGQLQHALHLYWHGSARRIGDSVRGHGLRVVLPDDDTSSIEVSSAGAAAPFIPRFRDVLPNEPRVGTKPLAVAVRGGGSFVVDVALRSSEPKPVRFIALSPECTRIALCHGDDMRGMPERSLVIADAKTGEIVARPARRQWSRTGCHGAAFLDENRVICAWADYLPRSAWTPRSTAVEVDARGAPKKVGGRRVVNRQPPKPVVDENGMCAVLEIVDVSALESAPAADPSSTPAGFRTLRVFGFSHAPHVRALGLSRDRRVAAIPSMDGAVLVDVVTGAEIACVGGAPTDAYPSLAFSARGDLVAWTNDAGPVVRIVGVDGTERAHITDALVHDNGRGFRDLGFDPEGRVLVVACRRHHRDDTVEHGLEIFDVAGGKRTWRAVEVAAAGATAFAFHPTQPLLALGFLDGSAAVVALPRGSEHAVVDGAAVARVPLLDGAVTALAFSDDGARFAAGDERGRVCAGSFLRVHDPG